MRPVRAKRSGHRAIRYKSVHAQIQHTSGFPLLSLAESVLLKVIRRIKNIFVSS
jgi:hypothetical protein